MAGKTVEVDETQLLAGRRVVSTVDAMLKNPKARAKLLEAQKIIDPNAVVPELDAKAEVLEEIAKVNKRLDDDAEARRKSDEDREANLRLSEFSANWEAGKRGLRDRGYTDEAIGEIEKIAKENAIANLDIAASHFDRLHPPAMPSSSQGFGGWNLFQAPASEDDGKFVKQLIESHGDDDVALNTEISKTLADVRSQRRAA